MLSTWYGLCFFKDLLRKTASAKILRDKAFNIVKSPNMINSKEVLLQWFMIFFFYKKSSGGDIKKENISSQELSKELD